MSKQKNPNIGMINCPICRSISPVRQNVSKKFYFDCATCGRITPNLPSGQSWVLENATIWGASGTPPAHAPEWITGNMKWRDTLVKAAQEKQAKPVITGSPDNLPAPPPPKKEPQQQAGPVKQGTGFAFLGDM